MQVTWYGHSCFLLTAENGYSILTDPCDKETGYALHDIVCDAVTVSHDHFDHNCLRSVAGSPLVVRTAGEHMLGEIPVVGYPTFHDGEHGAKRGSNIVFRYLIDGLTLVHLGDLGHLLDEATAAAIGPVDVLFAPIGGKFTIDAKAASAVAETLRAHVLIPMHYKTPALHFDVDGLEPLLAANRCRSVHQLNANTCSLTKENVGTNRLLILDYKR
ncbi:MAG TPA: MBL fold metallo-hydrolase [Feifaniaceae bacterium]|nr:MBL fold metallo-hydrolase [Feifaniaceae bacterium]